MIKKNKKRILWVDDDSKGMLSVFGIMLQRQGFELQTVVSLDSAIYLLQNEIFDIVITDIIFPAKINLIGFAGVYLINTIRSGKIKKDIINIPIIVLSNVQERDIKIELNSNRFIYFFATSSILEKSIFDHLVQVIEKS